MFMVTEIFKPLFSQTLLFIQTNVNVTVYLIEAKVQTLYTTLYLTV